MLAFLNVVVVQAFHGRLGWLGIARGFLAFEFPGTPDALTTILGAIGAAVGINMTFLYPYSILARGWGPKHKGLARFGLALSLFVPYVILTSLIIISLAATVHHTQTGYGTILPGNPSPEQFKPIQAAHRH